MPSVFIIIGIIGWIFFGISLYLYSKTLKEKKQAILNKQKETTDPKVVVIGGGTGQSIFLRGLKHYTQNITAIVTVADDGGGSGVLREDLGMLPPGDIRNCILALANIEPTMNEVMQYRFTEGALKGQSFGNLFIAAMNGIYGNFEKAVYKMSEIFAITGRVLPVTLEDVNLVAKLKNSNLVKGESTIGEEVKLQNSPIDRIFLEPADVKPLDDVINSIKNADIVILGPGSLYTSIIPNLLVNGVVDAISESKATKVYISNIMTQPGESDKYNVLDHVNAILNHTGSNMIDYVIANNEIMPELAFSAYKKDGSEQVLLDKKQKEKLKKMGIKTIEDNLIEIKKNYIRHDAKHISQIVTNLALSQSNDKSK